MTTNEKVSCVGPEVVNIYNKKLYVVGISGEKYVQHNHNSSSLQFAGDPVHSWTHICGHLVPVFGYSLRNTENLKKVLNWTYKYAKVDIWKCCQVGDKYLINMQIISHCFFIQNIPFPPQCIWTETSVLELQLDIKDCGTSAAFFFLSIYFFFKYYMHRIPRPNRLKMDVSERIDRLTFSSGNENETE